MTAAEKTPASGKELADINQRFYEQLWSQAKLISPERFNTWPLVQLLAANAPRRLEIAPGLRPRLPVEGTQFLDISVAALNKLAQAGGHVTCGSAAELPFENNSFDLVCVLDVIEHLEDDDRVLAELSRVAAPGAAVLIATPLHPEKWIAFDDFVGHCRRYQPAELIDKLTACGLAVEQGAIYGMQAKSSKLLDWAIWWLTHHPERAIWWYNHLIMPLALRMEKKLVLEAGLLDLAVVDEVLLVCRKKDLGLSKRHDARILH